MCGMCRESLKVMCVVTGAGHVVSKQPIMGGHFYIIIIIFVIIDRSIYAGSMKASSALQRIQNRTEIT